MGKICSKCGIEKPESEFATQRTVKSGLRASCKSCNNELRRDWYVRNKEKAEVVYAQRRIDRQKFIDGLKTPCMKCGEDRKYLIQFHHIDNDSKEFTIGDGWCYRSEENLKNEVNKCVCLCANCHFEFHHFYGKHPTTPKESLEEYLGGIFVG